SYVLQTALTAAALLLAALGALLLSKGTRGDSRGPSLDLTDATLRIGDGASVLRFRLEVRPSGGASFRAETRPGRVSL
ncbi:MAG TPA: hypothetical protein VF621_19405, partial [Pyrinomonadaceae bacterium]